mgnify:CR=1 FL=1
MANDRNDFAPEIRNTAWWASDTRQAVNNKAIDTILIKQGKQSPPDLSGIEAVQMGHVMQPIIGRLFSDRTGIEIQDADYPLTHPKHQWFRSHFDFVSTDGKVLVEAKNYSTNVRNKFDEETNRIPDADYAQLVHECAVHNIDTAYLAVLFGGQEFVTFKFDISEQEKEDLIKRMSVYWGHVQLGTLPEPQTIEDTKLAYPNSVDAVIMANREIEILVHELKEIKGQMKQLEEFAEARELAIRTMMQDKSEIRSIDGTTLVTWKSSKPSKRFNADLFKSAMPDIYNQVVVEQAGSRRFLIK